MGEQGRAQHAFLAALQMCDFDVGAEVGDWMLQYGSSQWGHVLKLAIGVYVLILVTGFMGQVCDWDVLV